MDLQDRFDRTVSLLYEAALTDELWTSAAASINDLLGTHVHSWTSVDLTPPIKPRIEFSAFFMGRQHRPDLERLYFRDYYALDEAIPRLYGLRDREIVYKSDLYTDQEKKTSAAYHEFRRPSNWRQGFFLGLHLLDGRAIVLSFGDSTERGGWGGEQIRILRRLAPHARQFARVRHALADAGAVGAALTAQFEDGRTGLITLDRRGRILDANDRARDLLLRRDGVRDQGGTLAAATPGEDGQLQRLLAQALPSGSTQGAGGSMRIARGKGRTLVLEVNPVGEAGRQYHTRDVAALVLLVAPAARARVDPDFAAAVLGLTLAEARVAVRLAAGQTAAGIAQELGCAESTVRTHVQRAFRKQGITKQTQLVRIVLSLETLRGSRR